MGVIRKNIQKTFNKERYKAFDKNFFKALFVKRNKIPKEVREEEFEKMQDPAYFMEKWGLNEENYEKVLRNLKIEIGFYIILLAYALYMLIAFSDFFHISQGLLLIILSMVTIIARLWRLSLVKNKKFKKFTDWIKS